MAEEQKPVVAQAPNAEAEKDVQNVLAELKGEAEGSANGTEKTQDAPANGTDKGETEEARIVAAAAKLGEQSEKTEKDTRTDDRGRRRANNSKFDPSSQKETDDPVEIRKQVEFYFSDSNLPMDKFLFSQVGGNKNNAVSLELLHSFKRMRRFQPFSAIVEALKTSETLDLTDNDTNVRRKVPLPESVTETHDFNIIKVFEDKAMSRSIYAKGFGEEQPTTQLDIESFFAPYGPINAIRLRRTSDKHFKGSVFVEFDSEEKQKAFLELDPKPQWKDRALDIKSKKEYCDEKLRDIEAGRIRPGGNRGRGGGRGGRGRGGRGGRGGNRRDNNRDWRERRDDDQRRGFRNDRDQLTERREPQKDARGVPVVQSTAETGQKRTRDEEVNGDHPAKKVDNKE